MRSLVFLLSVAALAQAPKHRLHTCMVTSKDYVVGAKLPPSGLFVNAGTQGWQHRGFNHPYVAALDFDTRDPQTLFLAAGNGVIRAGDDGREWKILTGNDVTELRDISVKGETIWFAHTAGIAVSRDGGKNWSAADNGIRRKYTEALLVDRTEPEHVVAGTEQGLFVTEDGGRTWGAAGAAGYQARRIVQSPHDAKEWLAATEKGGLFRSRDGGKTFESGGNIGVDRTLYDISYDPAKPGRIAVCGWDPGVLVSEDGGRTWQPRNIGLPNPWIWSVAFDPDQPGKLWASVHEDEIHVSDDAGKTWRRAGLPGSIIYRMVFVPEVRP